MRENKKYLYFLIFIFFLSFFAITSNGRYGGDGLENYLTAESIVLKGDLSIYNKDFDVKEMRYEVRGRTDAAGAHYTSFGIGIPLLLTPFYLSGHILSKFIKNVPHDYITQFFVSFSNPIIIALTALALFHLLFKIGFSKRTAFLTTVCYGFCTMSPIYARSGFSEPLIGLLAVLAVYFLYRFNETGLTRNVVMVALLAGYAILVKSNSLLYLPLLAVYLFYKSLMPGTGRAKTKLFLALFVPMTIFTMVYIYFQHLTGSSLAGGKSGIVNEITGHTLPERFQFIKGLVYYTISAGKGYFFYNLPLFLGLFGIAGLIRKKKELACYLLAIILFNFFFYSFRFERGSLFSWGPRYLYPTVPLMCIFTAEFIENSVSLVKNIATKIFLIWGFLVSLPCIFINFSSYLIFVKEQLCLQEYMINYIPDLSPLTGAWFLFISAIKRMLSGGSLYFIYNPDNVFVPPIKKSLENYDAWDLWWVHAIKISHGLSIPVISVLIVLIFIFLLSYLKLSILIKKQ